jgi:predicted short-subunit dehydrogenase-like oxidoreductase (DUF2520 family)
MEMPNDSRKSSFPDIVIVGSGNIASALAERFSINGHSPSILARNIVKAQSICDQHRLNLITDLSQISSDAFVILGVSDAAIPELAQQFAHHEGILCHCSGSVPMDALHHPRASVLYPLQTFSSSVKTNWENVAVFIEATRKEDYLLMSDVSLLLNDRAAVECTSEMRLRIHLAAVIACNFTNANMWWAEQILDQIDMPLELIRHLVETAIANAFDKGPLVAQTGPARRNDIEVIQKHMQLLSEHEKEIYAKFSTFITDKFHSDRKS